MENLEGNGGSKNACSPSEKPPVYDKHAEVASMDGRTSSPVTATDQLANSWLKRSDLHLIAQCVGTPVFVYSEDRLLKNVRRVKNAAKAAGIEKRVELYVPFFPNSNPYVLKPFQNEGVGILLQLPAEYEILHRFGFDKFIVSPGHVSDDEITSWCQTRCPLFLSSLDEISHFIDVDSSAPVNVRLDSLGSGKPGIKYSQLKDLCDLLSKHQRQLDCFELYCGSGNSVDGMIGILEQVFMIFKTYFPTANAINFAGGYNFVYEEWDQSKKHFEWQKYFKHLREISDRYGVPGHVKFLFEPARDLLGDVGTLLLGVKRNLITNPGANQVLTDGSRVLMPSAQYKDRHHNVIFLDESMMEINSSIVHAALRGRGILRHDYVLPGEYLAPECVGSRDHVVILDVGAYCATQHMEFLNIPPAAEVLIDTAGSAHLISSPGDKLDKWRHLLAEKKELKKS
jgi:diaminopimelate decarboxylase